MAIVKAISTRYGVNATYWRVTGFNIAYSSKRCSITFVGYPTPDIRLEGAENIDTIVVNSKKEYFDSYFSDEAMQGNSPRDMCYKYAKENDCRFEGAVDEFNIVDGKLTT